MPIYFLCLCPPRLSIKLNSYIDVVCFLKAFPMFELRLQINNSWFERKFKAENTELESNYVSSYIKHFNWDATPALNIGKLLTGPFFK